MTHGTHTLEVDSVQLAFGERRVLGSVYAKLETGRVTGLVGRNGCGKSCLMRIMYGLLDAQSKSVRIDGEWIEYGYKHGVTYLPQHHFIPVGRTVKNVMQDYSLAGERGFERLVAFFPAFARYYHTPVAMLSGGERRILEIYVVLSTAGLFCLLDEPFSQISPVNVATLKTLIAEEKPSKGILISDHRYEDVYEISDNLYIIAGGTTYSVSSPDDLRRYGYTKL